MATLTNAQLLDEIKKGMRETTDFNDDALLVQIADVKDFMLRSGVPESVVNDSAAVGCILRGVLDLDNYSSGTVGFSEYFKMRVTQLACEVV